MIIWIASYPKSGNTWLRAIMSQIIFNNNINDDNWISDIHKHIDSYPKFKHFKNLNSEFAKKNKLTKEETIKNWLNSQQLINQNKNIKIFKTHNMFCTLGLDNNNFSFTNLENTLGVIYIVRDPRNVITSLKNHFFLKSYDDAFSMITDSKRWIGILENEIPQAISSWEDHFKSWNSFTKNYILFKYEEILSNPEMQIKRLIEYLKKFAPIKCDDKKIEQISKRTSFENLKKLEKKGLFLERSINKLNNQETDFFYLGPKNDYSKLLDDKIKFNIEKKFKKTMKLLNYI